MVGLSASVNLSLHHKVQKFSSGTGSPGWSRKKGHKTVVVAAVISAKFLKVLFLRTKNCIIYRQCMSQKITIYVVNNSVINTACTISYAFQVNKHQPVPLGFLLHPFQYRTLGDSGADFCWARCPSCHPTNSGKAREESCTDDCLLLQTKRKRRPSLGCTPQLCHAAAGALALTYS